jgi:protein-disulfide isomerase
MMPLNRRAATMLVTGLSVAMLGGPAHGQSQADIASLRKDIEALKAGQAALQRQLQEIREMLRPSQPQAVTDAPPEAVVQIAGAPTKGDAAAKTIMIEFSDYQCPFCARYVKDAWPSVEREYIQTGRLRYVFRSFPLESIHKQAFKAHEAAMCAGAQGQYWTMHAQLFSHQSALEPADLKRYAREVGINGAEFDQCLDSGKMTKVVRADADLGEQIGVRGTPLFLIGTARPDGSVNVRKVITGAQPFDVIKRALDGVMSAK